MKKRAKLLASIFVTFVMLAVGIYGVYAAEQVTFGVTTNLSFTPAGGGGSGSAASEYIMLSGSIEKGPEGSLSAISEKAYSAMNYTVAAGQTELPNYSIAPTNFGNWEIGRIAFSKTDVVVKLSLTVKNYSQTDVIKVTMSGVPSSTAKVVVTENASAVQAINPGASGTYTLTFKLVSFTEDVSFNVNNLIATFTTVE